MATRLEGRLKQDNVVLDVRGYYADRTVLLTGATGLLGNVLVEKFLRDLPAVRRVYVLVRPRPNRTGRTLTAVERLDSDVLDSSIFDTLRSRLGTGFRAFALERIAVVEGDVDAPDFGLALDVRTRLQSEVDIIVNVAANVTFDAPLDRALRTNTIATVQLLDFVRTCRKRVVIGHVSTCYVSGIRDGAVAEEPLDPARAPSGVQYDVDHELAALQQIIDAEEQAARRRVKPGSDDAARRAWLDRQLARIGAERARHRGWTDVYAYTKAMSEQLIERHRGDIPVVIVRPSIIESALASPVPGWINNIRMADPIVVGYGRSQLSDFPGSAERALDIVPVDLVVNALLAAIPFHDVHGGPVIYQVASSHVNPITQREFVWYVRESFERSSLNGRRRKRDLPVFTFPSPDAYRRGQYRQLVPARIAEGIGRLAAFSAWGRSLAQRMRGRRLAIHRHMQLATLLAPYSMLRCTYESHNVQQLWSHVGVRERSDFDFDIAAIDWRDYVRHVHVPGLQKFVFGVTREPGSAGATSVHARALRTAAPVLADTGVAGRATRSATRAAFGMILRHHVGMTWEGLDHADGAAPFIAVSNHGSHADAAALMVLLGRRGQRVRPVAARDYFFSSPLSGWLSRVFLDAVPFERHAPSASSLAMAVSLLRRGHSLICFPEGGRSRDGSIGEFKRGAALMALEAGVPILPVRITGSFKALPKGSWFPRRHAIHVRFGEPISSLDYLGRDATGSMQDRARRLTQDVRRAIEQLE